MTRIKMFNFLDTKKNSPVMKLFSVGLVIVLTSPFQLWARDLPTTEINSRFGNYLAGRQAQFDSNSRFAIHYYLSALKKSPNNIILLRRLVALLISEGRVEEAIPIAKQLVRISNDISNSSNLLIGLAEAKNQKFKNAFENISRLSNTGLNSYLSPMLKAWLLVGQNKIKEALRIVDQNTKIKGLELLYGIQGALISEFGGNFEDAIKRYQIISKSNENANLRITILLGNLYERLGNKEKAREIYEKYKKEQPTTSMLDDAYLRLETGKKPEPNNRTVLDGISKALFSLGFAIQKQNRYQAILFSRLAIYLKPSFTIAKLLIAESLDENNKLKDANIVYYRISKDPNYSWAARLKIAHNLDLLGQTDEAIRKLQAMSLEKKERVDSLVKMGNILQRHKRYQASINAYEQAKKRIQNNYDKFWSLYFSLGISYERIDKWPMAEKNLLLALKYRPNHPSILNYLGYSWVEKGLQLDRAQKMIEKAVKLRPRDGYIIDSLGWALYRSGNIKGAVKHLERAVQIRPQDPTINDHLGDIYWAIGRKNEATFQWNRALILNPEKDQIPKIKRKLKLGLPKGNDKSKGI